MEPARTGTPLRGIRMTTEKRLPWRRWLLRILAGSFGLVAVFLLAEAWPGLSPDQIRLFVSCTINVVRRCDERRGRTPYETEKEGSLFSAL